MSMWNQYLEKEKKVSYFFKRHSIAILRISMGIIYFWYGLLKVIDISAVEELVESSTFFLNTPHFVEILGFWEMAIGLCFFIKKLTRLALLLFFLQIPGTFLPIFLAADKIFTHIPYGLTLEGQFVFKNLILVAVGFVLIGSLHNHKK